MIIAENIVNSYLSRSRSKNWAEWVKSNPVMADILAEAERITNDTD